MAASPAAVPNVQHVVEGEPRASDVASMRSAETLHGDSVRLAEGQPARPASDRARRLLSKPQLRPPGPQHRLLLVLHLEYAIERQVVHLLGEAAEQAQV